MSSTGGKRDPGLLELMGRQDVLSLDSRWRFRLPDDLAGTLHRALARAGAESPAGPPAAFERLAFYFVPGPGARILLYPPSNVHLAVDRFENPPAGLDPAVIRRARDYFYYRMRFVEADKQNRLQIPEGLREHAEINEAVEQIALVAHNHWLVLTSSELVKQQVAGQFEAFNELAADLLDPAYPTPPVSTETDLTDPLA